MKKVQVWYSIQDGGDGSYSLAWFLTHNDAEKDQELCIEEMGQGAEGTGMVETFEGSDIHQEAIENSEELVERIKALENGEEYDDEEE